MHHEDDEDDEAFKRLVAPRIAQIKQWLAENVKSYPTPATVTLFGFRMSWYRLRGSFRLLFDGQEIVSEEPFRFDLEQNGKVDFYLPTFCSPLGVPASYAAIQLTEATSTAILKGLHASIPRVLPCGLDKKTGKQVWENTLVSDRIVDQAAFDLAKQTVSKADYLITINTDINI